MRIEKIEIINFRQYESVNFEFKIKGGNDLHIVLGKNGMGKTNLLNAINWCLYNDEPHLGKINSGLPRINKKALKEAALAGMSKVQVEVKITISDDNGSITYERKQDFNTATSNFDFKSVFTVTCMPKGSSAVIYSDDENTKNFVNMYMPEGIRGYFFFDGEQLEKYFISEQGSKIKDAFQKISQVQLLATMNDRLKNLIADLQKEAGKKNKDISELTQQQGDLDEKIQINSKLIAELKNQIKTSEDIIIKCSDYLKGREGVPEKEKEYQSFKAQLKLKESDMEELKGEIHLFVRQYKILFSFYPAITDIFTLIQDKEVEGAFPPVIDKKYLQRMLEYHKCFVCDREMCDKDEHSVEKLLSQLKLSTEPSHILGRIKGELEYSLSEVEKYPKVKDKLFRKKKDLEKEMEDLTDKIKKLDLFLQGYSDKELIREMHERRTTHLNLVEENDKKLHIFEYETEKLIKALNEVQEKIKKDMNMKKEFSDLNRKIEFTEKANGVVASIEKEMMDEVRTKMTIETFKTFDELMWKKETFSHIVLNDVYNLELYDFDGYPNVGTCSAGEHALLALSFTLSLQKVSGYDSMLVIDTPLARIDTDNRLNFTEVLSKVSKNKQVILTLTPSEYSEEVHKVFDPIIATYTELVTKDEKSTFLEAGE